MLSLLNLESALSAYDLADIADLAAHGAVERSFLCNDRSTHAVCYCLGNRIGLFISCIMKLCQRNDLAVLNELVIAVELRIAGCIHLIIDSRFLAAHGSLDPAALGFLAGLCSCLLKAFGIN